MTLPGLLDQGAPDDPFASTPDASASLPAREEGPAEPDEFGVIRGFEGRHRAKQRNPAAGKRAHRVDHHGRTADLLEHMGIANARCERQVTFGYGASTVVKTRDLWGLFDRCGLEPGTGRFVGVQICAEDTITAHIRKGCSDEPTKGDAKRTYRQNAIAFLNGGGKWLVVGWGQPVGIGGRWEPTIREVTMQDVETVIAGGRLKTKDD